MSRDTPSGERNIKHMADLLAQISQENGELKTLLKAERSKLAAVMPELARLRKIEEAARGLG